MGDNSDEIQRACRLGDLDLLIDALIEYPKGLDETDLKLGWTGLYRSVICGHINTTEYLLQSGANPNIRTRMGDTALHQAAENRQLTIASLLLKYGADPNIQQKDGETALHLACFKGDADMVHLLLTNKANPNLQNSLFGKTSLHYASDYSYVDVIQLLLQFNANTELKDKHGKTPKDIARSEEVIMMLSRNSLSMPSPEPSEIPQKSSIECISPIISRSYSDISFISDYKSVETKEKQLEDFHKKIREAVRASVDTVKNQSISGNISLIFEPDAEKTSIELERKKIVSFGPADQSSALYNWLNKKGLDECYLQLVAAGYDDLQQISMQMLSKMPITEQSLQEIGIQKPGHRKRLMLAMEDLNKKDDVLASNMMNPFKCCTVEVSSNLFMMNMPGLDKWLETLNLKELYGAFAENGYDELDQILHLMNSPWEITAEDLIDIGISKPGYRHRILSKLKEDSWGLSRKRLEKNEEKKISLAPNDLCYII
ncbi:hypothetical protein SteCoe_6534 [Stentor coeruleus]|uniref:SAM domain-containing protein n=1 Tax=Stentor coeruleus TaxID=5963 RepID=A0A1R2CPN7_9CILI|nr:hypothetical protein SteCoe_6534 [Stentor coeruleus]